MGSTDWRNSVHSRINYINHIDGQGRRNTESEDKSLLIKRNRNLDRASFFPHLTFLAITFNNSGGSGGRVPRDPLPGPKFLHFHALFGKNWPNVYVGAPLRGWRPPGKSATEWDDGNTAKFISQCELGKQVKRHAADLTRNEWQIILFFRGALPAIDLSRWIITVSFQLCTFSAELLHRWNLKISK